MSHIEKLKSKTNEKRKLWGLILTPDEKNARMDICNSCEFLFKPTSTCKKCGCFMTTKTAIASANCPINKWPKLARSED